MEHTTREDAVLIHRAICEAFDFASEEGAEQELVDMLDVAMAATNRLLLATERS